MDPWICLLDTFGRLFRMHSIAFDSAVQSLKFFQSLGRRIKNRKRMAKTWLHLYRRWMPVETLELKLELKLVEHSITKFIFNLPQTWGLFSAVRLRRFENFHYYYDDTRTFSLKIFQLVSDRGSRSKSLSRRVLVWLHQRSSMSLIQKTLRGALSSS